MDGARVVTEAREDREASDSLAVLRVLLMLYLPAYHAWVTLMYTTERVAESHLHKVIWFIVNSIDREAPLPIFLAVTGYAFGRKGFPFSFGAVRARAVRLLLPLVLHGLLLWALGAYVAPDSGPEPNPLRYLLSVAGSHLWFLYPLFFCELIVLVLATQTTLLATPRRLLVFMALTNIPIWFISPDLWQEPRNVFGWMSTLVMISSYAMGVLVGRLRERATQFRGATALAIGILLLNFSRPWWGPAFGNHCIPLIGVLMTWCLFHLFGDKGPIRLLGRFWARIGKLFVYTYGLYVWHWIIIHFTAARAASHIANPDLLVIGYPLFIIASTIALSLIVARVPYLRVMNGMPARMK